MAFVMTVGSYGGFYISFGFVKRVCLGWVAFDVHPYDLDKVLYDYTRLKRQENK